ncbi:MAG: transcriptional repressor LexA [Clostridiales bacterium]|jgi:repressor LexA|nr:transcriptional repressor LexA [Clostridiales bacterium]MDR2752392.1 transcriptional repressor LexA [Clostridiales bacterium]
MSDLLTRKQEQILAFLKSEIRRRGYPPTVREICDAVQLSSTSTVHTHLETLERKGRIRRCPTKNRSIEILEENFYGFSESIVNVPIVGQVNAGVPILAQENIEGSFPIPANYIPGKEVFMLTVSGDSMIDAGIFDRDLIVVQQQPSADNGDIVVALIDDSATVKFFFQERGAIRLQPANESFKPIIVEDCKILGKVIGLYRKLP